MVAVLAAAAFLLTGCLGIPKDDKCTIKMSGDSTFGGVVPIGKVKWSATCKRGPDAPAPAEVTAPKESASLVGRLITGR